MVFISYSSKDEVQANSVRSILEENGIDCWMSSKSIIVGMDYCYEIPNALEKCDAILVLVSSNSMNSEWVNKEVGIATSYSKSVLPLVIDRNIGAKKIERSIFNNIQVMFSSGNFEEDCTKLIPIINKAEITTNDVIFETSFSNKENSGKLLIRSPKSKSGNDTAIFVFTEGVWNEFSNYVKEIVALLNRSSKDKIVVKTREKFGEYHCAPVDNQPYWKGPGRISFEIKDINDVQNERIKNFYFVLNHKRIELKIYFEGEIPESRELKSFGIDEEALFDVVSEFISFTNPSLEVTGDRLKYERTTDISIEYKLNFG